MNNTAYGIHQFLTLYKHFLQCKTTECLLKAFLHCKQCKLAYEVTYDNDKKESLNLTIQTNSDHIVDRIGSNARERACGPIH